MNIFSIVGIIISAVVLVAGLKLSSDNIGIFIDGPSAFIVLGGTFAATAIAFQLDKLFLLFKVFISHFFKSKKVTYSEVIRDIMKICEAVRNGDSIENTINLTDDPFLREGLEMISDSVIERKKVLNILNKRAYQMNELRMADTQKVKALGKFPPAFGMMGTTIGMIVLLANLGGADAMKMIGPAMGVCLITTLYGVILANLVIVPIGDNLEVSLQEIDTKNKIVIEGIHLILEKANPILAAEELNSYLLPGDRLDWKSFK